MFWKMCRSLIIIFSMLLLVSCSKQSLQFSSNSNSNNNMKKTVNLSENNIDEAHKHKAALVNVELGLGYLAEGDRIRAKTKLINALKLAPLLAETHSSMAYFLEVVGDTKEAELEHRKAIKLRSETGEGAMYNNYGAFLCRAERFKEADKVFQTALKDKSYSRSAEVYENAGLCALKASLPEKAVKYLQIALRQDPHREKAKMALANLKLENTHERS